MKNSGILSDETRSGDGWLLLVTTAFANILVNKLTTFPKNKIILSTEVLKG